ncbi:MAG: acyloxyacyl hydrolase [Caulobacteraceae bacterium]|nr:acyloxyacyl hydrolase [Caulobacteraceae bacterium]
MAGEVLVGAYAHDVTFIGDAIGVGAAGREGGADLHLGLRSDRIEALEAIGRPQAHAFVSINSEGTSNFAAVGLSWPIDITRTVYVRPGIGMAYTDGKAGLPPVNAPGLPPAEIARRLELYNTRIDFGSHLLFQPEIAIGLRLSERVSAELSWVHISNGNILGSGKNQGMDDAGVRLIYAF